MKLSIVGSLLAKDLSQFFKNRFVALITFLGMAFYIVFYFLTPVKVNETYKVGIYAGSMKHVFEQYSQSAEEGLEVSMLETEELLIESVAHEKFVAGIAFPEDILKPLPSVKKPEIHVYFPPHAMKEIRDGLKMLMGELVSVLKKEPFPVEIRETVLGNDMMGKQVSPRFKMRIMLAFVLLMLETFGLANLIAEEKEKGTMQAVLVTPATSTDVFVAKGITGVSLALLQAVFFLIIAGGLQQQPGIILLTLFLGAIMFTGLAFLIATKAKDFMTVISWVS